jgi:hypothetical protein
VGLHESRAIIGGMTGVSPGVELLAAFARARKRAERHMIGCERDGSSWREETISELVWQAARPYVMFADFTRRQEAAVGADWLWWWVDHDGEMLRDAGSIQTVVLQRAGLVARLPGQEG